MSKDHQARPWALCGLESDTARPRISSQFDSSKLAPSVQFSRFVPSSPGDYALWIDLPSCSFRSMQKHTETRRSHHTIALSLLWYLVSLCRRSAGATAVPWYLVRYTLWPASHITDERSPSTSAELARRMVACDGKWKMSDENGDGSTVAGCVCVLTPV